MPPSSRPTSILSLWGPVLFWCCLIYTLSGTQDLHSGLSIDLPLRKLAHLAEFGVLFLLIRRAAQGTWNGRGVSTGILDLGALIAAILFAMSDEYHQTFVPTRHGAIGDVLIDAIGALIPAVSLALRRKTQGRSTR